MISVKVYNRLMFIIITISVFVMGGCSLLGSTATESVDTSEQKRIKIGFSMDTLLVERWQRDRDIFVAKAKELGAEVIFQNANNDSNEQMEQVKYLLDQDIDILVIVPNDAEKSAAMVQMAKKNGKKVISYDRLVRNANVDIYVSFDNVKVGKTMAEKLVKAVPKGNYVIINGAEIDYNSHMFNEGYKSVLSDLIKKGDINIVQEVWARDWRREEAFNCIENVLQREIKIDGIIAANDSLAEAAIEALAERRLAGKVPVVGHDADLAGCQRVVEGTQLMTVYKPIQNLAQTAAEITVRIAKGEQVKANSSIFDGKYNVPYYMMQPIGVTAENIMDSVVHDGFHRLEDIYRNIPVNQWPSDKR